VEKDEDWDLSGEVDESRLEKTIDRFLGVCLGVAAKLVDEGVASIEDTDKGAKIGLRWTQGPFEIMNRIGIEKTCEVVQGIAERYPEFNTPELLLKQKALEIPFSFKLVDLEVKNKIGFITINRPEAMNSLNPDVMSQLSDQFLCAESNPAVKAIIIQGAGKAFIAGADVSFFVQKIKQDQISDIEAFTRAGHDLLLKIENSSKHTIALLDGQSMGGGSELALACQTIVATPAASMALPETGIGIFPGLGGMLRLTRQVGPALAKYYTFTGTVLSAQDAFDLGIVHRLAAPSDIPDVLKDAASKTGPDKYCDRVLPPKFQEFARTCDDNNIDALFSGQKLNNVSEELSTKVSKTIGFKAPLALKIANEIIDQQTELPMEKAVEVELERLREIFSSADALEGLSSLGRKRPVFQGQ